MMKLIVLASIATAALCMTIEKAELIADEGWQLWKSSHNRAYTDFNEEKVRYTIWQDNVRRITQFNRKNKKMSLRMNHFGDMTTTEFKAKMKRRNQRIKIIQRDKARKKVKNKLENKVTGKQSQKVMKKLENKITERQSQKVTKKLRKEKYGETREDIDIKRLAKNRIENLQSEAHDQLN